MPSKQEEFRQRVVSFYNLHSDKPRIFTVNYLVEEGRAKSTINNNIKTYNERKSVKEKFGKGLRFKKMDRT